MNQAVTRPAPRKTLDRRDDNLRDIAEGWVFDARDVRTAPQRTFDAYLLARPVAAQRGKPAKPSRSAADRLPVWITSTAWAPYARGVNVTITPQT